LGHGGQPQGTCLEPKGTVEREGKHVQLVAQKPV